MGQLNEVVNIRNGFNSIKFENSFERAFENSRRTNGNKLELKCFQTNVGGNYFR